MRILFFPNIQKAKEFQVKILILLMHNYSFSFIAGVEILPIQLLFSFKFNLSIEVILERLEVLV